VACVERERLQTKYCGKVLNENIGEGQQENGNIEKEGERKGGKQKKRRMKTVVFTSFKSYKVELCSQIIT
jgi:hypothetical protein